MNMGSAVYNGQILFKGKSVEFIMVLRTSQQILFAHACLRKGFGNARVVCENIADIGCWFGEYIMNSFTMSLIRNISHFTFWNQLLSELIRIGSAILNILCGDPSVAYLFITHFKNQSQLRKHFLLWNVMNHWSFC